jgi:RND superfamily putative drug exporter
MVMHAVNYNMDASGVNDLPSQDAQAYINQHFSGQLTQGSSTIVLLTSEEGHIYDKSVKLAIDNMTAEIQKAAKDGRIDANVTITSLYSSTYEYSKVYIEQIAPLYVLANNLSFVLPMFLFQTPMTFWDSYNDTTDILLMEYGVPALYYDNWMIENRTGGSIDEIDSLTYDATRTAVENIIVDRPSLNGTEAMLLRLYLADFCTAWNSTSSDVSYYLHPDIRLQKALNESYTAFMLEPKVIELPIVIRLYLEMVHQEFDLTDYTDFHRISWFTNIQFETVLDIIISSLPQDLKDLEDDCLLYYHTFYQQWNASSSSPSVKKFHEHAGEAANTTASAAEPPVTDLISVFFFDLGWEDRTSEVRIQEETLSFLSYETRTQPWLVNEIMALGFEPNSSAVDELATRIMANSTIPTFPLPMLPLITITMVGATGNDSTIVMMGFTKDGRSVSGEAYTKTIRGIVTASLSDQPTLNRWVTGTDPMTVDQTETLAKDLDIIDPIAIVLILVLIGLFFNSILAAALPPAAIGMSLGISFAALFLISSFIFQVNFLVITLIITASLGAGCDYCIFLLSRYREERRNGRNKEEAVEEAVTWAGETVSTSALTVIIGFGALFAASLDMIKSFGTLVIGIVLALMISLTFVPALLNLFGDKVFWPSKKVKPQSKLGQRYFEHSAKVSIKHAKVILLASVLISIPAIYVVMTATSSYDLIESMPECESKAGIEQMENSFGGGAIQPTSVALAMDGSVYNNDDEFDVGKLNSIEHMTAKLAAVPNIAKIFSPSRPFGEPMNYANLSTTYTVESAQAQAVMKMMIGKGNDSAMVNIIFKQDPFSLGSMQSITEIRQIAKDVDQQEGEITAAYVAGGTASMYDIASTTTNDFIFIIGAAIVLIYILLLFVLGSVLNPLRSILTILLSISWALAVTIIIFKETMGMDLVFLIPLILMVVCLGLGMDYDVLLSTRIREEVHKGMSTNDAIGHSMKQTGGIITICGVVMASAFGSLLLTNNPMLMQFGLALMVAILLDAIVVRTYMVPAIMSLLGKWNWWAPKRLQRTHVEEVEKK